MFFSEGGGKTMDDPPSNDPSSASEVYAADYNGFPYYYQVVQTAWDSNGPDWEDTTGTNSAPDTKNIVYAAGRPAAVLSWVDANVAGGTPPQSPIYIALSGQEAIEYDMTQDAVNLCTSHHIN